MGEKFHFYRKRKERDFEIYILKKEADMYLTETKMTEQVSQGHGIRPTVSSKGRFTQITKRIKDGKNIFPIHLKYQWE